MIRREDGALWLEMRTLGPTTRAAAHGEVFTLDTRDHRGRALMVSGRCVAGRLARLELVYAVRTALRFDGLEPDWEATRKDFHDAIVREWFASGVHDLLYGLPPEPGPEALTFRFGWGSVRSLHTNGRAWIEVIYTGDEA